ncbi:hypothetical protein [Arthrobacter sp.]|uniref:hypothetical protein n=1 Tax=Arthrobacter sp. TaxID=1667 RepID=UPI003A8DC920
MWINVITDVLGGLLVAIVAGVTTWLLGRHTYRRELEKKEIGGLRRLIGDLARKRALVEPQSLSRVESAGPGHRDFDAVSASVFNVRNAVDEARLAARDEDSSEVHHILDQMSLHCNDYLHGSRHDPENYPSQIHVLRVSLIRELGLLRKVHQELPDDEPGSKAYGAAKHGSS